MASGCDYFAEVAFPARVDCGLRAGRTGTSSVRYELALFRHGEALSLAAGQLTHAFVRWPERCRPICASASPLCALPDGGATGTRIPVTPSGASRPLE